MKKAAVFLSLIVGALCSCNGPYKGEHVVSAEEFVIDSYKIKKGKFAILKMQGKGNQILNETSLLDGKDVVGEDDVLSVAIHHPTRVDLIASMDKIAKTVGFRVQNGAIQIPGFGSVHVAGLTLGETKERLEEVYAKEIKNIEVFVDFRQRLKKNVDLAGLVQNNSVAIDGKDRLWDVLAKAKVRSDANLFMSYVVRDSKMVPVDLNRLVRLGDMSQNIVMKGGDKVYIADPASAYLLVVGEVNQQKIIPLPNGSMSVREAIAGAGGIPFTGDRRYIQVIRASLPEPKIYTLSWKHIVELPNDSLLCMPGDIVYIATTPIADWNRFVSQILPTFAGLEVFGKGVKTVGIDVGIPQ